ncbi:MAG TPA: carboxypeptidase regulatory-like domain-containing protein [Polyangia bacterium]
MRALTTGLALSVLLATSWSTAGSAAAGGTLTGIVRISKAPKPAPALPIVKDGTVCGREVPNESVVAGPDRGLANVVVSVKGLKPSGPLAPSKDAVLDQVGCRYIPHVQAATVGTKMTLLNSDAVFHNVNANRMEGTRTVTAFNVAMPFKGGKLPATLKTPGILKVRCDAGHTWMGAYVAVFDHPYFAVTDAQGRFRIADLPVGEHTVELWHEPVVAGGAPVVTTQVVKITAGGTATMETNLDL